MADQVVYGIIHNRVQAEQVIQDLIDLGVNPTDISLLSSQKEEFQELKETEIKTHPHRDWRTEQRITDYSPRTTKKETYATDKDQWKEELEDQEMEIQTKAPIAATAGMAAGGLIGGVLGLLAGIGTLAIPGVGPFVAAGPLLSTLSGIGAGGIVGGLVGALVGAGIPEAEAKHYDTQLKEGNILLAVRTKKNQFAQQVKNLMLRDDAEDVTISSGIRTSKQSKK